MSIWGHREEVAEALLSFGQKDINVTSLKDFRLILLQQ